MTGYMSDKTSNLRVLFCFGVLPALFDEKTVDLPRILEQITAAYANLEQRFGIRILGSFDDDQIMMGPSAQWPWTAYILADAPSYDAIVAVCNITRAAPIGEYRLSRYMRVEARIGRSLFFCDK
ncbi:MAG: hypothetical protein AB7N70_33010 [Dehalococcoidia bacterium]